MRNWLKNNWWKLLFFATAVVADAYMDILNFHVPHDSGWWSLHTTGYRGFGSDAWHTVKWFKWGFIVAAIVGKDFFKYYVLLFFAIINYAFHEAILHGKKKKGV